MNTMLWIVIMALALLIMGGIVLFVRWSRDARRTPVPVIGKLPESRGDDGEIARLRERLAFERYHRRAIERHYAQLLESTDIVLFLGPAPSDADTEDIQ